jgi:hypothetical protein
VTAGARRSRSAGVLTLVAAVLAALAAAVVVAGQPQPASALTGSQFHAGNIISDAQFYDSTAMTAAQVQTFLDGKVTNCQSGYTCLPQYTTKTTSQPAAAGICSAYTGKASETAAQIIVNVARACNINPQVLIVLLQKEQGLVTSTSPSASNYAYATGANCPDTTGCSAASAGFFKQVYLAAYQFQYYRAHPDYYNYIAGRNNYILYNPDTKCGGSQVYIENEATASLYIYTPYQPNAAALANLTGTGDKCSAYGNRNFWYFFNTWFSQPTTPYDNGGLAAVRTDGSHWYYANSGNPARPYPNGVRVGISGWRSLTHRAAGDGPGDGRSDLVGTRSDGSLWLYPNNGTGLPFPNRTKIGASGWTAFSTIRLGDLNGDGLADLLAIRPNGTMTVYLNDGNATHPFAASTQLGGSGWQGLPQIALGDVDGDGLADIVATQADGSLWLYRNSGNMSRPFGPRVRIGAGGWGSFNTLLLSDVDADGLADIVARRSDGTLWLYRNAYGRALPYTSSTQIGASGWGAFTALVSTDVPVPRTSTPGDLLATQPSGSMARFANRATRPYSSPTTIGRGWQSYTHLLLGDVNGDGRADLIAIRSDGTLWMYPNTGKAGALFLGADRKQIGRSGWQKLTRVVAGDVDGDKLVDLIATRSDGSLWLYRNSGKASAPYSAPTQIGASGWNGFDRLVAADVNGDGKADLVATRPDGSLVRYLSSGNPSRPYRGAQSFALGGWQAYRTITAGDVDGDGRADIVAVSSGGALRLDRDAGTDRFPDTTGIGSSGWASFDTVLAGDVDGDGLADLVVRKPSGALLLYTNTGDANRFFGGAQAIGSGWDSLSPLTLADVDGDGLPDLVGVRSGGTLWLYRNVGDQAGPAARPYTTAARSQIGKSGWTNYDAIVAANIDGDRYADLVARKPDGSLWLYRNTGDPSRPYTSTKTQIGSGWGQYDTFLAADVNGDGLADLIARKPDGTLWLYLNAHDPNAPFPTAQQAGTGWQAYDKIAAGDVDHDGRADLVATQPDGSMWLFHNAGSANDPFPTSVKIDTSGWAAYDRLLLQ